MRKHTSFYWRLDPLIPAFEKKQKKRKINVDKDEQGVVIYYTVVKHERAMSPERETAREP